jgi:hypothetical protein
MSRENNVVFLKNTNTSDSSALPGIYGRIRTLALDRLAPALAAMLDNADDALFERADKAENSQDQGSFFMAMRQLRLGRRDLEDGFRTALQNSFERTRTARASSSPQTGAIDSDYDLSLVDNEALEESIAIDGMIAKARNRDALLLEHIQAALNTLFPGRTITEQNNPLDPAAIVDAFVHCAVDFEFELAPRLIIYKLFDRHVLDTLTGLYQEIDRQLTQAGLRAPKARTAQTGSRGAALRGTHPTTTPISAQDAAPLLDSLRQLLGHDPAGGSFAGLMPGGGAPAGPTVSLNDLVGALSLMQRDTTHAGTTAEQGVKQALGHVLSLQGGPRTRIGTLEDAAIDIVSLLFEAILDDPQLPASIKALIARLQIPVLKVALLDGAFFSSKRHPARRLINEMAQAAIGWVEPAQVERDPLYRQIDNVVERVLGEFDDSVVLFEHLLDEFQLFLEEEQERARLVEERTRQAAEGKAKVDNARLRVDAEIQQRVAGRQLPAVVHQLLDDAWSKVLFLGFLKEGDDGAEWQQQLQVVDRLIASIEPKLTAEARRELLSEIPLLLHDLREGLNAILFNPFDMTKLFKQLEQEHVRCLTATEAEPAPPPAAPEQPAAAALIQPPLPVSDELTDYLRQLDEVPVGTWFEFVQNNGSRIRAKLSARLNDGRQLIFVNRSGFKMADRSLQELAQDLHDGKVIMLDDNLLFDKALETVVANLRSLRAGA